MSEDREAVAEEIVARFRQRLLELWPEGEADIMQIEDLASVLEREVLREVTQEWVREQSGKRTSNSAACPCGAVARYRCLLAVDFVTLHGRVRADRAYFHCGACRDGHCPQDTAWGIGPANTTPGVQALVGYLAAKEAYVAVPATLQRVRPQVHLGTKSVELIAQRLGEALRQRPHRCVGKAQKPLAVAVDGVMVPTRDGYKEARAGVIYEPDTEAGRTADDCRGLRKEYFGTFASRDELVRTVCARVEARRPSPEAKVAALGDGAHWIWEGYAAHLPRRVDILDFYHMSQHLTTVAQAMHSDDAAAATAWRKRMQHELLTIGPWELLRQLEAWEPTGKGSRAQKEVRRRELGYFERNQDRMHYPEYLRQGFPIGSGAVEGACKFLVSQRFKGAGMRWNPETAEPLLHLRATVISDPDVDLRPYARAA